jgi:hypothetical protein
MIEASIIAAVRSLRPGGGASRSGARAASGSRRRFVGWAFCLCAIMPLPAAGAAQQSAASDLPPVVAPLAPPPSRAAAAVAVLAPYRYGDLLWENDRTAHRIYGKPLEAVEPPSGSGIDSWGKNVPWPFADRQLRTGDQHNYHGEGLDFYDVGTSRGAGGLGIWFDNALWTSRNFVRYRILQSGGQTADFVVDYAPWPVDVKRKVWETRRFTLPLGTNFTRLVSIISSDTSEPLLVGIGIARSGRANQPGQLTVDRKRGLLSWWGAPDGDHGRMAVAVRVDPAMIADIREDHDNFLVILKVSPDKPFVYYSGSAWDKGEGGFRTRAAWDSYAASTPLDFRVPSDTPTVMRTQESGQ